MAGRRENHSALTFLRCRECDTGVAAITRAIDIQHNDDGTHTMVYPRPEHRDVAIWDDVRAALEHVRMTEFLLGFAPEKPTWLDLEAVQVQLMDARARLGALADALANEAGS
ncbi:hypothetical protein [Microbacterium soli]|uniref:Uncharacterized protein n=1 Tax=Microbacterium soli TaxID=446075 RepID=A0ABP7NJV5_9MICO